MVSVLPDPDSPLFKKHSDQHMEGDALGERSYLTMMTCG
jgi:hypothetical protein